MKYQRGDQADQKAERKPPVPEEDRGGGGGEEGRRARCHMSEGGSSYEPPVICGNWAESITGNVAQL